MAINKILLFFICCELPLTLCQISIPKPLRECYLNNATLSTQLSLNLQVLVDIIRKAERHSYTTMDMRMMSSSLLRRFKFDGIEYHEDVLARDGILPFSGSGLQRIKHRLTEELVPGNAESFPADILTLEERCVLHRAISNTVIKYNFPNVEKSCQHVGETEKMTGRTVLTGTWDCPQQQGVIWTPYGTVAPGAIIGAVAASLQHQSVAVNQLIAASSVPSPGGSNTDIQDFNYNEEEIDFVVPKSQMIHGRSLWHRTLMTSPTKVDNVWLTTIAGELAEMVVYQGPLVGQNMVLGAAGFWNNTMRPNIYYLTSSQESYDATRAELFGSIDGLIVTSNLQTWVQDFYSLRLSQVLDMYYSNRGVTFNVNVSVCNRLQGFRNVVPKTILNEQTYAVAQLLAYRKSIAYISPEALKRMVGYAVDKFSTYAENHLFAELPCNEKRQQARVEALIVFDGAWSVEYTKDFMAVLIQDLDVSIYGSKLGIIHGTSGEWLLKVTNSPSIAFQAIHNFTNIQWPTQFNYTRILETTLTYFNKTWEENRKKYIIGNLGQVVVLLIPLAHMSNSEQNSVLALVRQVKYYHPDVHFVYYTSRYNANMFKPFILSDEDHLINNSNVDTITEYLATIPRTIRPMKSSELNVTKKFNPQVEDYISPSEFITYRLHPYWRRNTKKILITIHTFGYGTMKVCSWKQFRVNERDNVYCKELAGYKEITMTDDLKCTDNVRCPSTFYRIQNVTSLYKCAEIDCKTPDQVRFIIRTQNVYYKSFATKNEVSVSFAFLFSSVFPIMIYYNTKF